MEEFMSFDPKYDDLKKENILYLSAVKTNDSGAKFRNAEILFNADTMPLEKTQETDDKVIATIEDCILLYKTNGGQQKIQCWIEKYNDLSITHGLRISRRTRKGVYANQEICLNLEATIKLKKFLDRVFSTDFNDIAKKKINIDSFLNTNPDFKTIKISQKDFEDIMACNIEQINNYDIIIEINKRKKAIERLKEIINNCKSYKNEVEITKFLKNNLWMFNNDYVFFSENNAINSQNILDLVPTTHDGFVDIIELKLPTVTILHYDKSHKNYYPSAELTRAISQCMNYIFEMEKLTIEHSNYFKPKATIIIGNSKESNNDEIKFLRLLNSSYHNIKIYTFQQLLIKAENSLKYLEKSSDI